MKKEKVELTEEMMAYLSDDMYLPIQYHNMIAKEPYFKGRGNHTVKQLEDLCAQFKEYCHQQAVIKQNCMKHIVELKFNVEFPNEIN